MGYDILIKKDKKTFCKFDSEISFLGLKSFPCIWYILKSSNNKKCVTVYKENLYILSYLFIFSNIPHS